MKKIICLALLFALICVPFASADESTLALQRELMTMGFFDGKLDGVYGEKTAYAVSRLAAYLKFLNITATDEEAKRLLLSGAVPAYAADASEGNTSENVLRVQRRLYRLGYLAYAPDGQYGSNTTRAVTVFQYYAGLKLTGAATRDTQEALFASDAPAANYPALKKGDKGASVEALQKRLALLGFFTGDVDRQYGNETSLGVKAFQTYVVSSGVYDSYGKSLIVTALDGAADPFIQALLFAPDFNVAPTELSSSVSGQEVYRLQRRLAALGYLSGEADGGYGADTDKAVKQFQKAMGINSKTCDIETLKALYSDSAKETVKPYRVTVDISDQRAYVYALDAAGAYTKLVSTMICSTGPDAVTGEYRAFTRPADKLLKRENDYLRFVYRLNDKLSISSIPYYDKSTFDKARLDALGQPMSEGGIMLSLQNAKLLWEKCPARTTVEIIE